MTRAKKRSNEQMYYSKSISLVNIFVFPKKKTKKKLELTALAGVMMHVPHYRRWTVRQSLDWHLLDDCVCLHFDGFRFRTHHMYTCAHIIDIELDTKISRRMSFPLFDSKKNNKKKRKKNEKTNRHLCAALAMSSTFNSFSFSHWQWIITLLFCISVKMLLDTLIVIKKWTTEQWSILIDGIISYSLSHYVSFATARLRNCFVVVNETNRM